MVLPNDFRDTCSFALADGTSIAVRGMTSLAGSTGETASTPAAQPTVLLVHGLGEHSGRYGEVARVFASAGYRFVTYDQRGHGQSSGRRCDCEGLDQLCHDLDQVLARVTRLAARGPVYLYGHSFGGMVVLWYLINQVAEGGAQADIRGALVTSPLIRAQSLPNSFVIRLGRMAAAIWPTLTIHAQIRGDQLSQLSHFVERFHADPFCQGRVTVRMGRAMLDSGEQLLTQAVRLPVPIQLHHGDTDPVTSWAASQEFSQQAGSHCEFVSWAGQRHELHHEPVRDEFLATMIGWIERESTRASVV